ncbi:transmembrane protein 107-like [Watersipora subatra]|uniref:transmembrane protein 107-like n=1 Tax=Watersipora subatra TaxID=2589382 RepID=UPI00355B8735
MKVNSLIPTRFMLLIAHLVVTIVLFTSIDVNILACLPEGNNDIASKRVGFIAGLSVTIGLIAIELIGFISGMTMFMPTQDLISICAHCSAAISLSFFIFESWPCDWFWWIFVFCSVFPAVTEVLAIIGFVLNWNF